MTDASDTPPDRAALERRIAGLERALDALRLKQEFFDQLETPLWGVDADDRTSDVNPALCRTLGYTREEMLGRSPQEFMTPPSREVYRAQSLLRESGVADSFPCTLVTRTGRERPCLVSGAPVRIDGRYAGKIAVLRDTSAWQGPDGALAAGRRLAELAHDLRTPLHTIRGFAGVLLRGIPGPLNDEQRRQLEMIDEAAARMIAVLEALRAPGGGGAGLGGAPGDAG